MNTKTRLIVTLCLSLPALAGTAWAAPDSEAFRAIYEKEWAFRLKEFPRLATSIGDHREDDRLAQVSEADQARRYKYWKAVRASLDDISCERLEHEECINYRIFRRQMDQFIADYETRAYLIPFNSDWGFYMSWPRMASDTVFKGAQDFRNYVSRLKQIAQVMDQYIGLMREGLKIGMTQPRAVLDGRDEPIAAQIVDKATDSAFFAPFRQRPAGVDPQDWPALVASGEQAIMDSVIPAYRRLLTFFRDEYVPGARKTLGATQLPGGERFYQEQIRQYATVDMTPDEIHQIGLQEVKRIHAEMDAIIKKVGFKGDFEAFLEELRTDPRFYAKTPHELLAEASYIAKRIDGRLPQLFGKLPRQPYGVAPVPDDIAPFFTAGRYVGAAADARQGGTYWVNTHDLKSRPLYNLPALTLHEAVPGHHLQAALALEQQDQPPFRRNDYISAYGEGWALYAEKLGVEMGIYETPYQDFGRLTYEMWRACRLVIDTGVHAQGWSREQAQEYLASNTALSIHEVTTEVDRYISWPAQALSYKLGEYTISGLRREAEQRLGSDFDVRAFHDFILSLGSVPLDVLKDEVHRWMAEQPVTTAAATPKEGARVFFVGIGDGAVVESPFTVQFGLEGMDLAPAGQEAPNSGHHHLLVDLDELPDLTQPLPANEHIRHFGKAQTQTQLDLPPGTHTLQLLLGDYAHRPHSPPVMSDKITITVK